MDHLAIRLANYVAGTRERPEVKVFVETNKLRPPIDERRLAKGQTVWMKWKSGPIVAKSQIESWDIGKFNATTVSTVRDLCRGTNLYDLDAYWESVRKKGSGYFTVIHLKNEEWLEPFFPAVRSYGSPWVYLDTPERLKEWLTPSAAAEAAEELKRMGPAAHRSSGRPPLTQRMRFNILRRDSYTCRYCGKRAPHVELEVDHVIPYADVKEHREENLVTACVACNRGKGRSRP